MALISSEWVFEEEGCLYCHWPSYLKSTMQREKAVMHHQQLKLDKCIKCPIAVKYSSDDYKRASMKLRLLEEEQSQSEESSSQFTNRNKGNRLEEFVYTDDDDDDDDDNVPPTPPRIKMVSTMPSQSTSKATKKKTYTVLKSAIESLDQPKTMENNISNNNVTITNCSCEKNSRILRDLVKEIQILKDDIRHLLRLHADREEYEIDARIVEHENYEKLKELDVNLKDEEYFKKCLTKFGLVGGKDVAETTRKILRLMISHQLAISLNWSGRNNKPSLEVLENVVRLIHGSVRRNPLAKNATNMEINSSIMNWLRNASDRSGGRLRRAEGREN